MQPKLTNKYRPKIDRQLLRDLIQEAWGAYHDAQFPETEQADISAKIAALLEQRFPPADMAVLQKYGAAGTTEQVSINVYDPDHQRWDCYARVTLRRSVLCPQGRAHFFVGGSGRSSDDHLSAEFEPYFNKILTARKAYNMEATFTPERIAGKYPSWEQIAEQLPVAGAHIRERLSGDKAS